MTQPAARVLWMQRVPGQDKPEMQERVVEGGVQAAVEIARTIAKQPNMVLGQVLKDDGRVHATFAPGSDVFHFAN